MRANEVMDTCFLFLKYLYDPIDVYHALVGVFFLQSWRRTITSNFVKTKMKVGKNNYSVFIVTGIVSIFLLYLK